MARKFNTTGSCLSENHYMIPPEQRLSEVRDLIDDQSFFVIHAPRQTGKTTLLRNLSRQLTHEGKFVVLTASLENFTQPDVDRMIPRILSQIEHDASFQLSGEFSPPDKELYVADPDVALLRYLSAWAGKIPLPLVIFFDEIDSLTGLMS